MQVPEGFPMHIGVKFPSREIGRSISTIREWVMVAAECGFSYVTLIDHVLGVDPAHNPTARRNFPGGGANRPYDLDDEFHEPIAMLGYLSGLFPGGLATGVIVLPQRQTALFAKQAAEIDLLCDGKLRLAVAVGWNESEMEMLGYDFASRGRRIDEQIGLLRQLWTNRLVTFEGEFDRIVGAGIAPLPVSQPIPIWIGGFSPRTLVRVARLGDGWVTGTNPVSAVEGMRVVRATAEGIGRDPSSIGLEGLIRTEAVADLNQALADWDAAGATHVTLDTMGHGLAGSQHVRVLETLAQAVRRT
jgi:probable F420-dependent oxidoreductase